MIDWDELFSMISPTWLIIGGVALYLLSQGKQSGVLSWLKNLLSNLFDAVKSTDAVPKVKPTVEPVEQRYAISYVNVDGQRKHDVLSFDQFDKLVSCGREKLLNGERK